MIPQNLTYEILNSNINRLTCQMEETRAISLGKVTQKKVAEIFKHFLGS